MGGVPSDTRAALYEMLKRVDIYNDALWAHAIRKLTSLGAIEALKKMNS